ncbi:N-acetylmuramoyl-L-alanine amidase family protein [Coraliomargarita sinensis]|uniref:N-acetylmuramoyl-L-alanine amidase family protein n=1 Tax=Coraliomargarita sinensis TaxID=2174842 RepID=UPI001304D155|nr:N-acetylmuramoyl-L-alanine amidase [Coraliomargarita sinensis]
MDYATELNLRYAPYADWEQHLTLEQIKAAEPEIWWRSPEAIRASRSDSGEALSGVHLAIDPGHIGGEWAATEGRDFVIGPEDFRVREGELVLEVARLVQAELVEMGAEVTLLRNSATPLNPKLPEAYLTAATERIERPNEVSWASLLDYAYALKQAMNRMYAVAGELEERARLVNEEIKPDALLSLHINAAPWPLDRDGAVKYSLVDSNHTHVLIFGCLSDAELSSPRQKEQLAVKIANGSATIERELGQALGLSLGKATALPASKYNGKNAVQLAGHTPYLWTRNLMLLRYVECPVVLLEPYIANSKESYPRIQEALERRHSGRPLAEGDILVEYAQGVVAGVLDVYGPGAGH